MADALITPSVPAHGDQFRVIAAKFAEPIDRLLDFSASIYPGDLPVAQSKLYQIHSNVLNKCDASVAPHAPAPLP